MSSYQYRKSHCGDKTVVRSSYLHNGISYTGKTTSLYWIRALDVITHPSQNPSSKMFLLIIFCRVHKPNSSDKCIAFIYIPHDNSVILSSNTKHGYENTIRNQQCHLYLKKIIIEPHWFDAPISRVFSLRSTIRSFEFHNSVRTTKHWLSRMRYPFILYATWGKRLITSCA